MQASPELEAVCLHKKFSSREILRGVDLRLYAGAPLVLLGPSGAGKTTLLKILAGLEKCDSGDLFFKGHPVPKGAKGLFQLPHPDTTLVLQQGALWPHLSLMENLTIAAPSKSDISLAMDLLERLNLKGLENHFPRQLSMGQRQRGAFARAILLHPSILLLDEVTAAQDSENVVRILNILESLLRDGTSVLATSHNLGFAFRLASLGFGGKIAVLEQDGVRFIEGDGLTLDLSVRSWITITEGSF